MKLAGFTKLDNKIVKIIFAVLFISIFIGMTFMKAVKDTPFADSSYAWYLSRIMNFDNFISILRAQGHFIVWYLILMPFAKFNIYYPFSLQTLNWCICFFAVVYLWRKSPFNILINAVITLSFVMTQYFAVIARCYSVGVLGLFIVASLYKSSLKRPCLYALILGLTLNTSLPAALSSAAFLLVFVYEIYKEKAFYSKKVITALIILILFTAFAAFPFLTGHVNFVPCKNINDFLCLLQYQIYIIPGISLLIVALYIMLTGKNSKNKFIYLFSCFILTIFLIFCYKGDLYHRFFFIIYTIIALWLEPELLEPARKTILLYFAFFVLMFYKFDLSFLHVNELYKSFGLQLQSKGNRFENSTIMVQDKDFRYILLSYAVNNGKIKIYEDNINFETGFDYDLKDKKTLEKLYSFAENSDNPVYLFSFEEIDNAPLAEKTAEDYYEDSKLYIYKLN